MPHLGAEFLDGRCALAVARDDPTADPHFNRILNVETRCESNRSTSRASVDDDDCWDKDNKVDRDGVVRLALKMADRWHMLAVCGSVGGEGPLFDFATSLSSLAKSPATSMLLSLLC